MSVYTRRTSCRVCDGSLIDVLDLGEHYLSGFHDPGADKGPKVPLVLTRCEKCSLIQLRDTADRSLCFSQYWYASHIAPQMVADLKDAMDYACRMAKIQSGDTILSTGVNDGTEMRFAPPGVRRIGIDPAENLASQAREYVDIYVNDFFPSKLLPNIKCDAVLTLACLYSMENLAAVCDAIHGLLTDKGAWIVQVSYFPKTLKDGNVGDIVHEHVSYFSVETLERMVRAHDLHISHYEFNSVNGGSVRLAIRKGDGPKTGVLDNPSDGDIRQFAQYVHRNGVILRDLLIEMKRDGKLCLGYGASTKFNSCMAVWAIGPEILPAIADRNPLKWGKVTPTDVPVVSEDWARKQNPDVFLVSIFQFLESIRQRETGFLAMGGKFLIPFPYPHMDGDLVVMEAAS